MKKYITIILLLSLFSCTSKSYHNDNVTIVKEDGFYRVIIDYSNNNDKFQTGKRFGEGSLYLIPGYEEIFDSYIYDLVNKSQYKYYLLRAKQLYNNLDNEYQRELDGFASSLSGVDNIRGDNKLSKEELYFINFIPDLIKRTIGCSYLGIEKDLSATNEVIFSRNLEWFPGSKNQILKVQGIIEYHYPETSYINITPLGHLGILTGIKNNGLSVSILDATTPSQKPITNETPYTFNLRKALENSDTRNEVFLNTKGNKFLQSHLIGTSDIEGSIVIENFTFEGVTTSLVRTPKSILHKKTKWAHPLGIPAVNSFLLRDNVDNHNSDIDNYKRLETMNTKLVEFGDTITSTHLMDIASSKLYRDGETVYLGSIFKDMTIYTLVYKPGSNYLNLFLKDKRIYNTPKNVEFKKVKLFSNKDL